MLEGSPINSISNARYRWYLAVLLSLAHLVSFVDRNLIAVVLEPLKAQFGLTDTMLGLLQGTSFVMIYSVAAIPLGVAADRYSRRSMIVGGLVVWSLATAACGLVESIQGLFVARMMVGLGEAALVPAALSLLVAAFPRQQLARAISLFTAGASLGKSAALASGGALLAWFAASGGIAVLAPWQSVFVVMALPGLVLALMIASLREPQRIAETSAHNLRHALAFICSNKAWICHTGAAACVVLLTQSFTAWTPSYYVRSFGLSPAQAGLATGGVLLIAAPLGHLAGGALTDWLQRRTQSPAVPVMIAAFVGTLLALTAFALADGFAQSILRWGLVMFVMTLGSPAALSGVQMLMPDTLRGSLTAIFLAITTLIGIGLGPPLVGFASDMVGGLDRAIELVLPGFGLLGILLSWASSRARR